MNIEAMLWARRQKCGGALEKGLLMQLAGIADARGVALVTRADLALWSELSRSAVERAILTLRALGLIRRAASAEFIEIELVMGEGR